MKKRKFSSHILLTTILSLLINMAIINAQTIIHRDSSMNFLTDYSGGLNVAEVPPAIDFGVADIGNASPDLGFSHWGNVVLGPDDKYYYAIGDHNEYGIVILKSYDPSTKTDEICIYSPDVEPPLADGKWHGRPVIDPNTGDMYLIGFYRGQVVKYNIYSKNVTNYGQVVPDMGWQEHIWDYKKNRLYGIMSGDILVYDTESDTVIFSGQPFTDFFLDRRARMLDNETGIFYGTGNNGTFYKYNPDNNVFTKLTSSLEGLLRASTNTKEADGSFWIFDDGGNIYKFYPDKDSLVNKGVNAEEGEYTAFIERSPCGNYLYYISVAGDKYLCQYNTNTGEKKVLAYLDKYYNDEYGFNISLFYGGALSKDGSSIFLVCNGLADSKSRAGLFHVHIPYSERLLRVSDTIYLTGTTCDTVMAGIDTVTLVNQYGADSLVITETTVLPSNTTELTANSCNPLDVGIDTLSLTNQYNCDSLVITETFLSPSHTLDLTDSIYEGESIQVGDSVFTKTGNYSVTLMNQYGCDSVIILDLTVINPTNIISIYEKNTGIKLYPNPTTGDINLSIENSMVKTRINIVSETGQIVFSKEYSPLEGKIMEHIDLKKYPNGTYFIQINSNKIKTIEKLILNR